MLKVDEDPVSVGILVYGPFYFEYLRPWLHLMHTFHVFPHKLISDTIYTKDNELTNSVFKSQFIDPIYVNIIIQINDEGAK